MNKLQQLKDDIALWENNLGFFANSKNADLLKAEFEKKFEEKARAERKVFSFDSEIYMPIQEENVTEENIENNIQEF